MKRYKGLSCSIVTMRNASAVLLLLLRLRLSSNMYQEMVTVAGVGVL